MDGIAAVALVGGGADLHAPETVAGVEDEVVAVAVSPGLGYAEAKGYDFVHEGQFGKFSATLGWLSVAEVGGRTWGWFLFVCHMFLGLKVESPTLSLENATRMGHPWMILDNKKGAAFGCALNFLSISILQD
jgi:hypothetical protein